MPELTQEQLKELVHYDQDSGVFTDPEEAHQAYLTAKRQLHAGCTI